MNILIPKDAFNTEEETKAFAKGIRFAEHFYKSNEKNNVIWPILQRLKQEGKINIAHLGKSCIELDGSHGICFEFDKDGKLIELYV